MVTETLIKRAAIALSSVDAHTVAEKLVEDGVPGDEAFLTVMAASIIASDRAEASKGE